MKMTFIPNLNNIIKMGTSQSNIHNSYLCNYIFPDEEISPEEGNYYDSYLIRTLLTIIHSGNLYQRESKDFMLKIRDIQGKFFPIKDNKYIMMIKTIDDYSKKFYKTYFPQHIFIGKLGNEGYLEKHLFQKLWLNY